MTNNADQSAPSPRSTCTRTSSTSSRPPPRGECTGKSSSTILGLARRNGVGLSLSRCLQQRGHLLERHPPRATRPNGHEQSVGSRSDRRAAVRESLYELGSSALVRYVRWRSCGPPRHITRTAIPAGLHRSQGTVTDVQLINPHSWIYMDVKGKNGEATSWALRGHRHRRARAGSACARLRQTRATRSRCAATRRDGSEGCLLGFMQAADGSIRIGTAAGAARR